MLRYLMSFVSVGLLLGFALEGADDDSLAAGGMSLDARGGKVIAIPGLDMSKPGAQWRLTGYAEMVFEKGKEEPDHYRLITWEEDKWDRQTLYAPELINLRPNRNYMISMVLDADFERPAEINVGLTQLDPDGKSIYERYVGIPNKTGGWQHWECVLNSDPRAASGELQLHLWDLPPGSKLRIAELSVVELPAVALRPFGRGEGATFRGGPGSLPMRVEEVAVSPARVVVRTTGARYTFDLQGNTILAEQVLERQREIALWESSLSFAGLHVLRKNGSECVLANDSITFGVQCDSLVMVVPHGELKLGCESKIGGKWNRLIAGYLLVADEYGGMTADPTIPLGSGRLARVDAGATVSRSADSGVEFTGKEDDQTFLSSAQPGWRLKYYLSPGERIAISVFPPRPYPWKQSFEASWLLTRRGDSLAEYPMRRRGSWHGEVLWDFFQRSWAFSWGREHVPYSEQELRDRVAAIKAAGSLPLPYMSGWFYYSRDAAEFAAEVKRLRDRYGFEGVYYDGLPVLDWIAAYEEMRLTHEIYPEGMIILHHTSPAPLSDASLELPAVSTYAGITYMGELVAGQGPDWPYPRYMAAQYRKGNCIGVMKSDAWEGVTDEEKELIMLRYNGRGQYRTWPPEYYEILQALQKLWQEKGDAPDFYERFYLPKYEEMMAAPRSRDSEE